MDRRKQSPRPLIAGNWKMHGLGADLGEIAAIAKGVEDVSAHVDVALCVPFTLIARAVETAGDGIAIGAQDVHANASGAHTGNVSAAMIAEAGARLAIVGHSERRADQHESSAGVRAKAGALLSAGMDAIVCVGESLADREAGRAIAMVEAQLRASLPLASALDGGERKGRLVVAYEPIWAIGTGRVPGVDDVAAMHAAIRAVIDELWTDAPVPILYGGSVKPSNAAELLAIADVDGALVGGASLKAADFLPIVRAAALG